MSSGSRSWNQDFVLGGFAVEMKGWIGHQPVRNAVGMEISIGWAQLVSEGFCVGIVENMSSSSV